MPPLEPSAGEIMTFVTPNLWRNWLEGMSFDLVSAKQRRSILFFLLMKEISVQKCGRWTP